MRAFCARALRVARVPSAPARCRWPAATTNLRPRAFSTAASFPASTTSVYESVKDYYGRQLKTNKDLQSSACCTIAAPHPLLREIFKKIPDEITEKYYGCGSPVPFGIDGLSVLDLGSGSGRDCYAVAGLVGPNGSVTGIDMTENQLSVARKHVPEFTKRMGYPKPNLRFVQGYIECLKEAGIQNESMDLVISNCVVNLSPDKPAVLQSVWNALKPGGEFYFSDIYCDRRLPERVKNDELLYGECLGGALYVEDFVRICRSVGFADPRVLSTTPVPTATKFQDLLGNANFTSITYRLFKLPGRIETLCEDYGQTAVYHGTIPGHRHSYPLDDHHLFITNKPMLVCGNTASMVGESWMRKHFTITGDRSVHYGLFPCGPAPTTAAAPAAGGGCC